VAEALARDALGAMIRAAFASRDGGVAIADGEVRLEYRALRGLAEDLGARVRAHAGDGEAVVALEIERSWRLAASAFALVAAGFGFTVLDPALPRARREAMLRGLGSALVLRWPENGAIELDAARFEPCAGAARAGTPEALAYVIFTSGSTGTPKAAAMERRNLAELARWHVASYGDPAGWTAAQIASSSFDVFVWDVFGTLCGGGTLEIVHEDAFDPYTLWRRLAEVEVAQVPTPLAHVLFADESMRPASLRLRDLLTGGDRLLLRPRPDRAYRCVDHYGPSECTVLATWTAPLGDIAAVPVGVIGVPIPGQQVVVVDDALRPLPNGETGEILIAGSCVGRGYLDDPARTSVSFLTGLPWLPSTARAYRTGDLGRVLDNGAIEFRGRRDAQVKVRGFRIELGDVEAALASCPGVVDVVAGTAPSAGETVLVTLVIRAGSESPSEAALRRHAAERLPAHMLPDRIVFASDVPRTATGKIDRRRALDAVR
jgi:amino acid adenylation domain-containing protein